MSLFCRSAIFVVALVGALRCSSGGEVKQAKRPHRVSTTMTFVDPRLPGISSADDALEARLWQALADHGPDYEPRTRHRAEGGAPRYVNRLIEQTSPYLLQHAHNPVNWFPWGEEAFERAAAQNRPVFLSVGYSTCHWCHVMERESFEDEEVAAFLNEHFIAIKVDREERPDIDDAYMTAVQAMTGHGGWPMTVVLTPSREPIFGGTYFPARDGDRGARYGLLTILGRLLAAYQTDQRNIVARAKELATYLRRETRIGAQDDVPSPKTLAVQAQALARSFDSFWGGFGSAPKFPMPSRLFLLLRYARRTDDEAAKTMVVHTLLRMADGGVHDQIGGGFHRYSTDERWLVPHFEKMLYDNAQLAQLYLEAWQLTGEARFAEITRSILDYLAREMTSPEGLFYSATDADSPPETLSPGAQGSTHSEVAHDEEGLYFTWTPKELAAVLGEEQASLIGAIYGVTAEGNFEGRSILHLPESLESVAKDRNPSVADLNERLRDARVKLYEARQSRRPPLCDRKILTAWNALAISAFARAAFAFDDAAYGARAEHAADALLAKLRDERGRLMRSYLRGKARHRAFLEDYAFLIVALLDLYEATGEPRFVDRALVLQGELDEGFADAQGGYFQTSSEHEALFLREKPGHDGALASGNSLAAFALLRLAELTGEERYRERVAQLFRAFATPMMQGALPMMSAALESYHDRALQIVIVRPDGASDAELLGALRNGYYPNHVLVRFEASRASELSQRFAWLEHKAPLNGMPTAYVCRRGGCELPASDAESLRAQIGRVEKLFEPPVEKLRLEAPP